MGPYNFYDLQLALSRESADNVGEVHVSWPAPAHGLAAASLRGDSSQQGAGKWWWEGGGNGPQSTFSLTQTPWWFPLLLADLDSQKEENRWDSEDVFW